VTPQTVLEAGLRHLAAGRRDWDCLELRWAGAGDLDPARAEATLQAHALASCRTLIDRTALIRLESGSWDEYLNSRGGKWRNNYRRWERRTNEVGESTLLRYRPAGESHGDGDPRWDLYESCAQLAARSWQGSSRTGTTLSHQAVRDFLRDVHAAAARLGALDLNLLLADGRPLAFAYNYHYGGYVFGLRVGYDEQYSRCGVGNVIYMRIIEDSFRRQDAIYDMGPGSIDCKQSLLTEVHPIFRHSHFRSFSLRAQLLRVKRTWDAQAVDATLAASAL